MSSFWDTPPTLGRKKKQHTNPAPMRRALAHRRPAIKIPGEIGSQRHDVRLGTALGRMCAYLPLDEYLERAGEEYGKLYRRAARAEAGGDPIEMLNDDELRRRKEQALSRLRKANDAIVAGMAWLEGEEAECRMYRLCVLDCDPPTYDVPSVRRGLIALAKHFGFEPKKSRSEVYGVAYQHPDRWQ